MKKKKSAGKHKIVIPRKTFIEKLRDQLIDLSRFDDVEHDGWEDENTQWLCVKISGYSLQISFNGKGDQITDVSLFQDVVEVVDQKKIW